VGEHFSNSYIGESKGGILESDEVELVNGKQELFFKFLANGDGEGVFHEE